MAWLRYQRAEILGTVSYVVSTCIEVPSGFPRCATKKFYCNESPTGLRSHLAAKEKSIRMADRTTGVVKWFHSEKGYGFISPDDGSEDLFAHFKNIRRERDGRLDLEEGQHVEFSVEEGDKGLLAADIVILD